MQNSILSFLCLLATSSALLKTHSLALEYLSKRFAKDAISQMDQILFPSALAVDIVRQQLVNRARQLIWTAFCGTLANVIVASFLLKFFDYLISGP
jgi:hypothetical protein